MATRGFFGRRPSDEVARRLPPGQHRTEDFPVLAKGPTPRVDIAHWKFTISDGARPLASWNWTEFEALPQSTLKADIHCVTQWSKLDTTWSGVTIDDLLQAAGISPPSDYLLAESYDDYDTNLPVADLIGGKGMVATRFGGSPLEPEHGGPARLVVPHLYFWKSAKWVRRLEFMDQDQPGFWEELGYHMYGDPWREQRYAGD